MTMLAALCTACFGLTIFGLGITISNTRNKMKRASGYNEDPKDILHKLVRAHGNTCEYAPLLCILFFYLEYQVSIASPGWKWIVYPLILAAAASRLLLTYALVACKSLAEPDIPRIVGAWGGYITGILLCLAALMV